MCSSDKAINMSVTQFFFSYQAQFGGSRWKQQEFVQQHCLRYTHRFTDCIIHSSSAHCCCLADRFNFAQISFSTTLQLAHIKDLVIAIDPPHSKSRCPRTHAAHIIYNSLCTPLNLTRGCTYSQHSLYLLISFVHNFTKSFANN